MICIPMAGKSTRFYTAGYTKSKFQLEVGKVSLFRLSVLSFLNYFESETFLFVLNKKNQSLEFVKDELKTLKIRNYKIVQLDGDTRGQAETVALALVKERISVTEHLLIFNIDTIRPNFKYPNHFPNFPWLETFTAEGEHWSFILPKPNTDEVLQVVEKQRISDFCSTGIYFFPKIIDYLNVFNEFATTPPNSELFVAPLYQQLITQKKIVKFSVISPREIFLAGTPSEFRKLKQEAVFNALGI